MFICLSEKTGKKKKVSEYAEELKILRNKN